MPIFSAYSRFVKRFLIEPNLIVNAVFEETVDDVQLIRVFSVKTNKLLAEVKMISLLFKLTNLIFASTISDFIDYCE